MIINNIKIENPYKKPITYKRRIDQWNGVVYLRVS